jgi:orotate phosphoribosyltransferase
MDGFIATLTRLNGYYKCPKDEQNKRLGPLVGYAGRYDDNGTAKQWVGDVYANCAVFEEHPRTLVFFTDQLANQLSERYEWHLLKQPVICGLPMGGIATGMFVAARLGIRFVYPEKKVLATATASSREKSQLVFGRHGIIAGEQVILAEDVLNNFSTTGEAIDLVTSAGGQVRAIVGLLNRSLTHDALFQYKRVDYPIICVTRIPIHEYKQDDSAVIDDIRQENVCWKPKDEWSRLQQAMKLARK